MTSDHLHLVCGIIRAHHRCAAQIKDNGIRVTSMGRVPIHLKDRMLAPRHLIPWLLLPSYNLKRSYAKDVERGVEPNLRLPLPTSEESSPKQNEFAVNITQCVGSGPETRLSVDLFRYRCNSVPHVDVRLIGRLHLLNVELEGVTGLRNPTFDDWDSICSKSAYERLRFVFWYCKDIDLPAFSKVLGLLTDGGFTFKVEAPARVLRVLEDYEGPLNGWKQRKRLFCEGRILEDPGDPPEDPHGEAVAQLRAQLTKFAQLPWWRYY